MYCPFCKAEDSKVIDSQLVEEKSAQVRPCRECLECQEQLLLLKWLN